MKALVIAGLLSAASCYAGTFTLIVTNATSGPTPACHLVLNDTVQVDEFGDCNIDVPIPAFSVRTMQMTTSGVHSLSYAIKQGCGYSYLAGTLGFSAECQTAIWRYYNGSFSRWIETTNCTPSCDTQVERSVEDLSFTNATDQAQLFSLCLVPPAITAGGAASAYSHLRTLKAAPSTANLVKSVVIPRRGWFRWSPQQLAATVAVGGAVFVCTEFFDYLYGPELTGHKLEPLRWNGDCSSNLYVPGIINTGATNATASDRQLDELARQGTNQTDNATSPTNGVAPDSVWAQDAWWQASNSAHSAQSGVVVSSTLKANLEGSADTFTDSLGTMNFGLPAFPPDLDFWKITLFADAASNGDQDRGGVRSVPMDLYPPVLMPTVWSMLEALRLFWLLLLGVALIYGSFGDVFASVTACAGFAGVRVPDLSLSLSILGNGWGGNWLGVGAYLLKHVRVLVTFAAFVSLFGAAASAFIYAGVAGAGFVAGWPAGVCEVVRTLNLILPLSAGVVMIGVRLGIKLLGMIAVVSHVPKTLEPE